MDSNLTERQREILDFIRGFHGDKDYFPTLREIGEHFGLALGTVQSHLDVLKRKGALDWDKGKPRALRISEIYKPVEPRPAAPAASPWADWLERLVPVPLLGRISAGTGVLAVDDVEDTLVLPQELLRGGREGEVFGVRVKGDSMIDAGIREGDLLMVRQASTAEDGDIVVALLGGEEATVKYLRRRPDGYYLVAANPNYAPRKMAEGFTIRGKVVSLLRRY